ncbi:MAG: pitrilysin family protein [Chloroflexota bacterium]
MSLSQNSITRLTLPNGLLVLLKEIHTAPLISQWIWYRVGSRDETPGSTGASHWVEHMQFKGTPRFPSGILDKAIARLGGAWNAFTFLDWTTYYETLPADKIDLALELEADRMFNSLFTPDEFEAERTVIISERQGNENEPLFLLGEEMQAAAFRVHAYHHEVIGDLADLQTMQRDDLYAHYRAYYNPSNAVLAIAGDFETQGMLDRLRQIYEPLPAGKQPMRRMRLEPAQPGERHIFVEGPGETTYAQLTYHTPEARHPDFFPVVVLDSLLTGPSSLNLFGAGISNKTSRLYRALVEKELAVSVYGGLQATIDPFLHSITAIVHPQRSPEQVIAAVDAEISRLQESPPPAAELAQAVKQARALFAYSSESISNQAYWLGLTEMFASYNWFSNYLASLEAVTPLDVQRVAQSYLRPKNRVLGVYRPTGQETDD